MTRHFEDDTPTLYQCEQAMLKEKRSMSLMERMAKAGSIKAGSLNDSVLFNDKDFVQTNVPIINVAASGRLDGGLSSGLLVIAGPSKHFKSNLGLIGVSAYMKKYPDAICLFYDSEFGITPEYIAANGIDGDRVMHIPIMHIEELKFDIAKRLDEIKRGDKVVIFIDSVGNLASKKEVEDALNEKAVADMTRAKALKSLFRIVTPHLTTKDIPCIVVNHTYMEQGMFPKAIVSGGTGIYYSANAIWIIGRSQEKDSDGIQGYNFTINIEKSRFVKEKSKMTFQVMFDSGVSKWSGLLDAALESGHVIKPKNGWYQRVLEDGEMDEKNYREKDTNTKDFWMPILTQESFQEWIKQRYQLTGHVMIEEDEE
jgi:RecA/RadA recombinase